LSVRRELAAIAKEVVRRLGGDVGMEWAVGLTKINYTNRKPFIGKYA
jgi:hypothetical protein